MSPRPLNDDDVDMDNGGLAQEKPHAKVVVVTNLTRNVVEAHLRAIFGSYGEVQKVDLPVFGKCALLLFCSTYQRLSNLDTQRDKIGAEQLWNTRLLRRRTKQLHIWMVAS